MKMGEGLHGTQKKTEKYGTNPLTRFCGRGSIVSESERRNMMKDRENFSMRLNEEHDRLLPLYEEMTKDAINWKDPFTAVVPTDEFDDYSDAAVFFVGAPLVKMNTDYEHTGVVDVSCVGYYAAVGA